MGKANVTVNQYFENNERFADLFNVAVFKGKKIVVAEELSEMDTKARRVSREKSGKIYGEEYVRDHLKTWKRGADLLILGLEPEASLSYALPVKLMKYESIQYEKNYREIREAHRRKRDLPSREYVSGFGRNDLLTPMITLVLYHGKDGFDAPKSLHEILDFEHLPPEIRESVRTCCNNFHINLLDVNHMEDADKFTTDLREVFGFLKRQGDKGHLEQYVNENEAFRHLSEDAYNVIACLGNETELSIKKEEYQNEEGYDMCLALQQMQEEAFDEGKIKGSETINLLGRRLVEDGRTNDLVRSLSDRTFQQGLLKEYGLS